jgi:hypothetical protein
MNTSLPIYAAKNSTKIITFCSTGYELLQYCSQKQMVNITRAAENNFLECIYFDKNGKVRAKYK